MDRIKWDTFGLHLAPILFHYFSWCKRVLPPLPLLPCLFLYLLRYN